MKKQPIQQQTIIRILIFLFIMGLLSSLTSCDNSLTVQTKEGVRFKVEDYDNLYNEGDSVYVYTRDDLCDWYLNDNPEFAKDTIVKSVTYTTYTYKKAVVIK